MECLNNRIRFRIEQESIIYLQCNKPVRNSTNVCVSILFFKAAKLDDNAEIVGDGNKPAFNMID